MRAIVVGGGIAGTAVAMGSAAVGVTPVVLEAADDTRAARGSWLTVAPNGLAALAELGALDAVRPFGVATRRNLMLGATGRELGSVGLGDPLSDGTTALSFRRPELAAALTAETRRRGIDVRTGARAVSVHATRDAARVTLGDGTVVEGDILIGADGIHSVVRPAIDPAAPRGRYVGLVNFGGITRATPIARELAPEAWTFVFGRRAFFGALPTPAGDVVWFVNVPRAPVSREERAATTADAWSATLADLAAPDAGPFEDLIRSGELELAGDNTHDLPKVPTWHRDRLALVGDALHAPSPSSGQGAAMAMEDGVALAAALAATPDHTTAFARFEAARRARVERIVADGARSSSSKTAGPIGRVFQDAMLRFVFSRVVTDASRTWVYDHRESLGDRAAR